MTQTTAQYDFSMFEDRKVNRVNLSVVKGGVEKGSKKLEAFLTIPKILLMAVTMALLVYMLQTQSNLVRVRTDILQLEKQITKEKSEYSYLAGEKEMISSKENIQEYAARTGMFGVDNSQITYIRLNDESVVEPAPRTNKVWNSAIGFLNTFANFLHIDLDTP